MTARASKGVRAALKRRKVARAHFDLVVGDGDLPALVAVWEQAKADQRLADLAARRKRDDPDAMVHEVAAAAAEAVTAAEAAISEQVERVWFRALPGPEFEKIRIEHPAPPEGEPEPDVWSRVPALAAACAEDSDLSVEEWAEEIAGWSRADYLELSRLLHDLQARSSNAALAGKAFGTTR